MDKKTALSLLETTCQKQFGCELKEATKQQVYKALCIIVKDILVEKNVEFKNKTKKKGDKQVYYMSMEFLVGTSLHNNLYNLKIEDKFKSVSLQNLWN